MSSRAQPRLRGSGSDTNARKGSSSRGAATSPTPPTLVAPSCTGSGTCERVRRSSYPELLGVPVTLTGLARHLATLPHGDLPHIACRTLALALGFGL
jgi:hypothetical protein